MNNCQLFVLPRLIDGEGTHGDVYQISMTRVAKFPAWYRGMPGTLDESLNRIALDFKFAGELYSQGIAVPYPETLREIKHPRDGVLCTAFIMELIPGINGFHLLRLNPSLFKEAESSANVEINRAEDKGYIRGDLNSGNFIWCHSRRKSYLVDFVTWGKITRS